MITVGFIFCDACGDLVSCAYPLTLKFHDNAEIELNVCIECYENNEVLEVPVKRKHSIAKAMTILKK